MICITFITFAIFSKSQPVDNIIRELLKWQNTKLYTIRKIMKKSHNLHILLQTC